MRVAGLQQLLQGHRLLGAVVPELTEIGDRRPNGRVPPAAAPAPPGSCARRAPPCPSSSSRQSTGCGWRPRRRWPRPASAATRACRSSQSRRETAAATIRHRVSNRPARLGGIRRNRPPTSQPRHRRRRRRAVGPGRAAVAQPAARPAASPRPRIRSTSTASNNSPTTCQSASEEAQHQRRARSRSGGAARAGMSVICVSPSAAETRMIAPQRSWRTGFEQGRNDERDRRDP